MTVSIIPDPVADLTTATGGTICGGLDGFNQPFADSLTISTTLIPGASYRYLIMTFLFQPLLHLFSWSNFYNR